MKFKLGHLLVLMFAHLFCFSQERQEAWAILNQAGSEAYYIGDNTLAKDKWEKALVLAKEQFDTLHTNYTSSLSNLATLYLDQGAHDRAKKLYQEVIAIQETVLIKDHPDYIQSLNNLADLYVSLGEYAKAERLYLKERMIKKQSLGDENAENAVSLNKLAAIYHALELFSKAKRLCREAMALVEKASGKWHPAYAQSLHILGLLYEDQREFEKARLHYLEAMKIRKKVQGIQHPDYASSLGDLATINDLKGNQTRAQQLYTQTLDVFLRQIDSSFPHLSEKEKDRYFQTINYKFEAFHSFVLNHAKKSPELLSQDFRYLLAIKGLLFDTSQKLKDRVLSSGDTTLIQLYNKWRDQGQYVNSMHRSSLQKLKDSGIDLVKETEQLNVLEREISSRSTIFTSVRDTVKYTWKDIRGKLLPGEAAIEMARFRFGKEQTDSVMYLAFIVTAETKNQPEMVVMPNGNQMENDYLQAYRRKLKRVYTDVESYLRYWAPLSEKLVGIEKVYLSPDGVYHNISLAGLYDEEDGTYLADQVTIHRLSGTDQLMYEPRIRKPANQAYLVGEPTFNSPEGIAGAYNWAPLPYTLEEVDTLEQIMKEAKIPSKVYIQAEATEEVVKSWNNPRIVHIATHAFFLEDETVELSQNQTITGLNQTTLYQNPLLRSVMLLANAKGELFGDGYSGALSAKEVLSLKLDQTELVVLSSCETGKGVIKNGEGIYGFQRAFLTAGSETVLASLWKVDDLVTQELMINFYRSWLVKKLSKREAFKQAREAIRERYVIPRYWAAFVMIGQ